MIRVVAVCKIYRSIRNTISLLILLDNNLCDVEQSFWVSVGNLQQSAGGTRRQAPALLPILQCSH
jgi:hypothetical protein